MPQLKMLLWQMYLEEFLQANNLFTVKSRCADKDQYITRPDLGRRLDEEAVKL